MTLELSFGRYSTSVRKKLLFRVCLRVIWRLKHCIVYFLCSLHCYSVSQTNVLIKSASVSHNPTPKKGLFAQRAKTDETLKGKMEVKICYEASFWNTLFFVSA